jgi:hypothetical protein
MIPITRAERQWFLRTMARGIVDYLGTVEPPVPIEDLLTHPPDVYSSDFGVVEMFSNLWDATFARPPSQRGSIFVRIDLEPAERRFALARETLSAMITSKHGRALGLYDMFLANLKESAEYFARHLLAPEELVHNSKSDIDGPQDLAEQFMLPYPVAELRWREVPFSIN